MSSATLRRTGRTAASKLVPAEAVTQAGERRSARIESVRAVASMAVVGCHAWGFVDGVHFDTYHSRVILGSGQVALDIFFAQSGFLMFLPFARRDYGNGSRVNLGGYAVNRMLRVLPLYYVTLVVLAVVDGVALSSFLRFAVFAENFKEAFVGKFLDGPMWSLVVEVHFYVLLPLLAWGMARVTRGSAGRAAAILLALGAASVCVYEARLTPPDIWTYSLPTNFVFFVPGMLLALMRTRTEGRLPKWTAHPLARSDVWVPLAIASWLAIFIVPSLMLRLLPAIVVGTFLVVGTCTLPLRRGWPDRVLEARPLAVLGIITYSVYLWHNPVLGWLPRPAGAGLGSWFEFLAYALPICVLAGLLSYRLVEYPPLRLRRRWFAGSTAPVSSRAA